MAPSTPLPRTRVSRGSISRNRVVAAALDVIDEHGLAGLTMPRVATTLGVGTMSLYRHVANKADLLDAIIDHVFSDLTVPAGSPDDIGRVLAYLALWRDLAMAHPRLAPLVSTRPLPVAGRDDLMEEALSILIASGMEPSTAVEAHAALLSYTVGSVILDLSMTFDIDVTTLPWAPYRTLHSVADELRGPSSEMTFRNGLVRVFESFDLR